MIATAHFLAILLYLAAATLAASPLARPVRAPLRTVLLLLGAGVLAHSVALVASGVRFGQLPGMGLGPALSLAAFFIALTLLVVEIVARESSLAILAAPLAAVITAAANMVGLIPTPLASSPALWIDSHIALSFLGIASFATAAAAGTMYLVERHELKSRRLAAVFRMFPPLNTLDRVNQVASIAAWVALTAGVSLAFGYAHNFQALPLPKLLWAIAAWIAITFTVLVRPLLGWSGRRTAILTGISFASIVALYLLVRLSASGGGVFL